MTLWNTISMSSFIFIYRKLNGVKPHFQHFSPFMRAAIPHKYSDSQINADENDELTLLFSANETHGTEIKKKKEKNIKITSMNPIRFHLMSACKRKF